MSKYCYLHANNKGIVKGSFYYKCYKILVLFNPFTVVEFTSASIHAYIYMIYFKHLIKMICNEI